MRSCSLGRTLHGLVVRLELSRAGGRISGPVCALLDEGLSFPASGHSFNFAHVLCSGITEWAEEQGVSLH